MTSEIEIRTEIEPIAGEWDGLADRLGAAPSMYSGWIAVWQRWFGSGELAIVCVRDRGELTGLLPVVRRRGAISSPANWHTPSFEPLAASPETSTQLVRAALASRPHRLDFAFVYADSAQLELCGTAAQALRYHTVSRVIERSPYVKIDTDWQAFEAALPSRRRSKLRRFRRRLEERGSIAIELERGGRELGPMLAEGFAIEASGWKGERGTAINSRPETKGFYEEIARWAAERGWLRLWFLRLDGRVIAFAFCLEHAGRQYELKVGFDTDYASNGPGILLTRARLEHSFEAGLKSYEFLGQAEKHKLDWTDHCRELARLQAFAPTVAGQASRLAWTRGRAAALKARELARRAQRQASADES